MAGGPGGNLIHSQLLSLQVSSLMIVVWKVIQEATKAESVKD